MQTAYIVYLKNSNKFVAVIVEPAGLVKTDLDPLKIRECVQLMV